MIKNKLIQPHNQVLFEEYNKKGFICLGPYSSYTWRHDPKHLFFTMARYKFCAKMLAGKKEVFEIGCGDALGTPILLQEVEKLHCVDLEQIIIMENIQRNEYGNRLTFEVLDITKSSISRKYDAAISLDVIEHIPQKKENLYMGNICDALKPQAMCIIGTPNITAKKYASPNSAEGHINLKNHETLRALLDAYFHNSFIFSMNDELIHTGFYPMAQYLMGIGIGIKKQA